MIPSGAKAAPGWFVFDTPRRQIVESAGACSESGSLHALLLSVAGSFSVLPKQPYWQTPDGRPVDAIAGHS